MRLIMKGKTMNNLVKSKIVYYYEYIIYLFNMYSKNIQMSVC